MSFREHMRELRPHAEWKLAEKLVEWGLGSAMLAAGVGLAQKMLVVSWDWWILILIFLGSFGLLVFSHRRENWRYEHSSLPVKGTQSQADLSSLQLSPRDEANREKIVVLARAYAQPAYAFAQQVTNRLWDRMRNSDDMKDRTIAGLGNRYVFTPCNHASAALSNVSLMLINELDGPDKNDIESLQQYLKEFFDAYQDLIEWTNLFTQLFSFSLRKDPEYDMWQEKHKLFYEELARLIAADDFSQLKRKLRGPWQNIY